MAHEIAKTQDGRDAMIFAGETPWHRLGSQIPEDRVRDLDWALEEAGLGFDVQKTRHAALVPVATPEDVPAGAETVEIEGMRYALVPSADHHSVVRMDTHDVIGNVGNTWHPLQNREAFEPLRTVLDDGFATIESGGVLRGGKQVWMLVRFDQEEILRQARNRKIVIKDPYKELKDMLFEEEGGGILPYGLFTNDHSGSGKARVKETAIRVVCANTLDWSTGMQEAGFGVEVTHLRDVAENYREQTEAMMRSLIMRYAALADHRRLMRQRQLDTEEFRQMVLDTAVPVAHLERRIAAHEGTAFTKTQLEKKQDYRSEIEILWIEGKGQVGDRSAWDAYNGLVEWLDHSDSAVTAATDRVQSLMDGTMGKVKNRVFGTLLEASA